MTLTIHGTQNTNTADIILFPAILALFLAVSSLDIVALKKSTNSIIIKLIGTTINKISISKKTKYNTLSTPGF